MSFTLIFNELQEYDPSVGITIPVILTAAGKSYKTLAKLDSGASHCIFRREHKLYASRYDDMS